MAIAAAEGAAEASINAVFWNKQVDNVNKEFEQEHLVEAKAQNRKTDGFAKRLGQQKAATAASLSTPRL